MKLSTTLEMLDGRCTYAEAIQMVAQAGFDAYDMNMCKIHLIDTPIASDGYRDFARHLRQVADECGIVCNQAHAPFPTQLNKNDVYNQKSFDMLIRSMEVASILGAKIIVVHPIKNSSSSSAKGYTYEPFESRKQLYDTNIRFFKELIPYCEKFGIRIAIENMWERHPIRRDVLLPAICGYAEEQVQMIRDVGSEWIVACLDIGHTLICGEKPNDAIRTLASHLKALHIHDSNGYEDSHALPYSMSADWDSILRALADVGYDGDFTFEVLAFKGYPDPLLPQAVRHMHEIGRYMVERLKGFKTKI